MAVNLLNPDKLDCLNAGEKCRYLNALLYTPQCDEEERRRAHLIQFPQSRLIWRPCIHAQDDYETNPLFYNYNSAHDRLHPLLDTSLDYPPRAYKKDDYPQLCPPHEPQPIISKIRRLKRSRSPHHNTPDPHICSSQIRRASRFAHHPHTDWRTINVTNINPLTNLLFFGLLCYIIDSLMYI